MWGLRFGLSLFGKEGRFLVSQMDTTLERAATIHLQCAYTWDGVFVATSIHFSQVKLERRSFTKKSVLSLGSSHLLSRQVLELSRWSGLVGEVNKRPWACGNEYLHFKWLCESRRFSLSRKWKIELLQGYVNALFHDMIMELNQKFNKESLRLFGVTLSVCGLHSCGYEFSGGRWRKVLGGEENVLNHWTLIASSDWTEEGEELTIFIGTFALHNGAYH